MDLELSRELEAAPATEAGAGPCFPGSRSIWFLRGDGAAYAGARTAGARPPAPALASGAAVPGRAGLSLVAGSPPLAPGATDRSQFGAALEPRVGSLDLCGSCACRFQAARRPRRRTGFRKTRPS